MTQSMLQDPNLLPVLQIQGWQGKGHTPCTCLVTSEETEEDADVFLSYGTLNNGKHSFIMNNVMAQEGVSMPQVEAAAKQNLNRQISELEWTPLQYSNFRTLSLNGGDSTAAAICLQDFLTPLHQYFNNETVYLAIPNRFTIIASDDSYYFAQAVHKIHQKAITGNHGALTPHLYVMLKGVIIGQAQLDEEVLTQSAEVPATPPIEIALAPAPAEEVPQIGNVPAPPKPKTKVKMAGSKGKKLKIGASRRKIRTKADLPNKEE